MPLNNKTKPNQIYCKIVILEKLKKKKFKIDLSNPIFPKNFNIVEKEIQ